MKDVLSEAISLPVEDRSIVVDSLLRSLNAPNDDVDREWAVVAQGRL